MNSGESQLWVAELAKDKEELMNGKIKTPKVLSQMAPVCPRCMHRNNSSSS